MRHIKLFEDYSDEELDSLQQDLEGIGHKYKFVQGEDFGFGDDFLQPNYQNYPTISKEVLDVLIKKGEVKPGKSPFVFYYFANPKKFGIPKDKDPEYPEIRETGKKGVYFIDYNGDYGGNDSAVYDRIIKALREIRI